MAIEMWKNVCIEILQNRILQIIYFGFLLLKCFTCSFDHLCCFLLLNFNDKWWASATSSSVSENDRRHMSNFENDYLCISAYHSGNKIGIKHIEFIRNIYSGGKVKILWNSHDRNGISVWMVFKAERSCF
jgi:hypothetical protein